MSDPRSQQDKLSHLRRIVERVRGDAFGQRQQSKNGWEYFLRRRALSDEDLRAHLNGGPNVGVYLMKPNTEDTRVAVLDLDDHDGSVEWEKMSAAALSLARAAFDRGMSAWPLRSGGGRGVHLFFIWDDPQPAAAIRSALDEVLHVAGFKEGADGIVNGSVEIYPKQDCVKDFGALIALPFGRSSVCLDGNMQPIDEVLLWRTSTPVDTQGDEPGHDDGGGHSLVDALRDALRFLSSDEHKLWVDVGHALKRDLKDEGYALWDEWSVRSEKYPGANETRRKWDRDLKPSGDITIGSIAFWARKAGWKGKLPKKKSKKPDPAELLNKIAEQAQLFHTPDGLAYADIEVNGHRETWPVRSRGFRDWITREYFRATKTAPPDVAVKGITDIAEARARFESDERQIWVRVATGKGRVYLDLCDDGWRAVEIDAKGWRVVDRPDVRFRRARGMLPLPMPVSGGSVDELRPFLNVDDEDFILTIGWLFGALGGRGPYPILVVSGEHGSAKSTYSAMIRALVDPNKAPLRALLRHDHDLYIAAHNAHVVAFDNISRIADWLSDTLCRLATGGGFSARELYSDADEMLFDGSRPIILNGIENFVERPDLADRVITLTLNAIGEEKRRPERELWAAFDEVKPRLMGALLDAVSVGLREAPHTSLATLPRMADFALWIAACESALWEPGTFEAAYANNRQTGQIDLLDVDPVGMALRKLASEPPPNIDEKEAEYFARFRQDGLVWKGRADELLRHLSSGSDGWGITTEEVRRDRRWPRTARELSGRIRRMLSVLRQVGIDVEFKRTHGENVVTITKRTPPLPGDDAKN